MSTTTSTVIIPYDYPQGVSPTQTGPIQQQQHEEQATNQHKDGIQEDW